MAEDFYFKFFGRDFRDGVRGLKADVVGVYIITLTLIYEMGGAVPDDDAWIAAKIGFDIRVWKRCRAELVKAGKLRARDGKITNKKADRVLAERDRVSEARSAAGKKGGETPKTKRQKPTSGELPPNFFETSPRSSQEVFEIDTPNLLKTNENAKANDCSQSHSHSKILDDEMSARASVVQISASTPDVIWQRRKLEFIALMAGQLNMTAGCFTQTTKLKNLCEPATGPPCDWERDVVPAAEVVRDRFAARGELIFSWTPIVNEILRHRDQRLAGNPQAVIDQTGETYVKRGAFADARNNPRAQRNARHRAALEVLDESGRLAPLVKRASAD